MNINDGAFGFTTYIIELHFIAMIEVQFCFITMAAMLLDHGYLHFASRTIAMDLKESVSRTQEQRGRQLARILVETASTKFAAYAVTRVHEYLGDISTGGAVKARSFDGGLNLHHSMILVQLEREMISNIVGMSENRGRCHSILVLAATDITRMSHSICPVEQRNCVATQLREQRNRNELRGKCSLK